MPDPREHEEGRDYSGVEQALHRLSEKLDVPPPPPYAATVERRLGPAGATGETMTKRGRIRRLGSLHPFVAAGAAVLVLVAVIISVPATRQAIAELFDLGGVQVHPLSPSAPPPRTTLDPGVDFGEPVTLVEARDLVSFPVAVFPAGRLGPPDVVYVRQGPGLETVSLVYRPRTGFPAGLDPEVGIILSEYDGTSTPYFDKYVDQKRPPIPVAVAGAWPGLFFPGPQQVLIRDPSGVVHDEYPRLSAPTLVWERGGITYRLEANIDRAKALRVAATLP